MNNLQKAILVTVILLSIILTILIMLMVFKSDVQTETLNYEEQIFDLPYFNIETEYPTFTFDQPHQITINGRKYNYVKEFQLNQRHFEEGWNQISIRKIEDNIIFNNVSKQSQEISIYADFTAPEGEIISEFGEYGVKLMMETFELTIVGEPDATLMWGDIGIGQIPSDDEHTFEINLPHMEATNQFILVDEYQNKTNLEELYIYNFAKEGYERVECGNLAFPKSNLLRYGISGVREEQFYRDLYNSGYPGDGSTFDQTMDAMRARSYICSEEEFRAEILLESDSRMACLACGGPGVVPTNIVIEKVGKSLDEVKADSQKYNSPNEPFNPSIITRQEDYVNRFGVNFHIIEWQEERNVVYEGKYYYRNSYWYVGETLYSMSWWEVNNPSPKISEFVPEILENIVVK